MLDGNFNWSTPAEDLSGGLIAFVVGKFFGETEHDCRLVREEVSAERLTHEIISNAQVADAETRVVNALVIEIQRELFLAVVFSALDAEIVDAQQQERLTVIDGVELFARHVTPSIVENRIAFIEAVQIDDVEQVGAINSFPTI